MSYEQLKEFVAKVKQDKTLQDQVKKENADLVYIAKVAGFSITTDDLRIAYTEWVRDSLAKWNTKINLLSLFKMHWISIKSSIHVWLIKIALK